MIHVGCCGWRKAHDTVFSHFRLHGIDGYYHTYSDDELERVQGLCDPFETTYVLFNNVSMWEDALRFRDMLGQR